jgi:hypothetical protein
MNLQTMRQIADLPDRAEHRARAENRARAGAPAVFSGRSLTLLAGRVLPTVLALVIGGHLML